MLNEKVTLVTGGSHGIGKAIVAALLEQGASVICIDKELPQSEIGGKFCQFDLFNTAAIEPMINDLWADYGKIDILVNCAGIYPSKPSIGISEQEWDQVLCLNLKAPFLLTSKLAKRMIEDGVKGSIVNIASTAGKMARPGVAHYCASKAGLLMMTRVLALEFAPYDIRVNSVCPGLVETENVMSSLITEGMQEEHQQKIAKTPLRRAADPREIARAVLYFVDSGASGYTTGQELYVDGGYTAGQVFTTFERQLEGYLNG